ncbi:MAG: class I SAM-dependent methyltransferase [Oscillospiraceae bacterium]|nr:class I SAM-dependent methyltransferase [Oscillospiraceae bacterium]
MDETPENEYKKRASLTNILAMAKRLFGISIKENGTYADFTMGNGNDALYMKKACPSGSIYAFDIQQDAVETTKKLFESENCLDAGAHLICDSHANFRKYIHEKLDGAIFNLGYLPKGDKSITTMVQSTLECLRGALEILEIGGVIVVCAYPGHDEGAKEGEEILELAKSLDHKEFDCLYHRLVNIPAAPYIIAFQKKAPKRI